MSDRMTRAGCAALTLAVGGVLLAGCGPFTSGPAYRDPKSCEVVGETYSDLNDLHYGGTAPRQDERSARFGRIIASVCRSHYPWSEEIRSCFVAGITRAEFEGCNAMLSEEQREVLFYNVNEEIKAIEADSRAMEEETRRLEEEAARQ